MRKGSDLIGKPVVSFDSGEELEQIQDLIFDQNENVLLGFVVDEGGWFSGARVLPLNRVQAIGTDAIIVPSRNAVIPAESDQVISRILERNNVLKGTKIMTTDGQDLGTMADLYFDEKTGVVEGYEASGGIFADAVSGRSFVPAPQTLKIGEDVAFVPPETAQLMEEQVGGLRGAVQTASDSVQSAATGIAVNAEEQRSFVLGRTAQQDVMAQDGTVLVRAGEQVTQLHVDEAERQGKLSDLYRGTGGSLTAGISGAVASRAVEQAEGRRVQQAVRTDQGLIIAAPGQIVTEQVINRARTYNKEQELMDAAGLSTADAARSAASQVGTSVQGAAAGAGDAIQSGAQQVKEGASSLWDRLKSRVNETQDTVAQEAEERRIKYALGRPTTRVILDPQDNVILNVGEIITHHAIDRARQSGVLDILLSSVYDKDPEITPDELRAPEPGEASLEQQDKTIGA